MEAQSSQNRVALIEPEWEVARLFPARGEWTDEDYLNLPEHRRVELVGGCLDFLPSATESHQFILGHLYRVWVDFVRLREAGLVLLWGLPLRMGQDHFRLPDLMFMHRDHAGRRQARYWDGADAVLEVVSPEGRKRDIDIKRDEYARGGIPEYWIVDPDAREIHVLELEESGYRIHGVFGMGAQASSVVLPGFSVSVEEVFLSAEQPF